VPAGLARGRVREPSRAREVPQREPPANEGDAVPHVGIDRPRDARDEQQREPGDSERARDATAGRWSSHAGAQGGRRPIPPQGGNGGGSSRPAAHPAASCYTGAGEVASVGEGTGGRKRT